MSQETLISQLKEKFPEAFLDITEFVGEKILHLKSQNILLVLTALKSAGYNFLADLTAIDNLTLGGFERFAVSYHLLCHETAERLTVKAYVSEEKPSPSESHSKSCISKSSQTGLTSALKLLHSS